MKTQNNAKSKFGWRQLGATTLAFQLLMAQSFMVALPMLTIPTLVASAGAVEENDINLNQNGRQNFAAIAQYGDGNNAFVDQINSLGGSVPGATTIISELPDTFVEDLEVQFEHVFPEQPYTELQPNAKIVGDDDDPNSDITSVNPFANRDLFGDIRGIQGNNPIMDFLETLANNVVKVVQDGSQNSADVDQGDSAGHGSVAVVNQDGVDNAATIQQVNGANWGQIAQDGEANEATIVQSLVTGSTLNHAYVDQNSDDDAASVFQEGTRNLAAILQDESGGLGGSNTASIDQDGDQNFSRITQRGNGNEALIEQIGDMNLAQILQDGISNVAEIFQNGVGNEATISQFGSNNMGFITQTGDNNIASITQTGFGHQADITQTGDGNTAHVVQSGDARPDPVVVNQTGGASIFIHY